MDDLIAAHRHTVGNWRQIHASRQCGCCSCLRRFAPDEIVAWTGIDVDDLDNPEAVARQTAMCPYCGSEAVLGDASGHPLDPEFLQRMNVAWFEQTIVRPPSPDRGHR